MNDLKKQLGQRIKSIRLSRKLTQEEFCARIQIEIPTLSNIERGKSYPTVSTLKSIIDVFYVQPNDIFDFEYLQDEETIDKEIFDIYKTFSLCNKQYLLRLIKFIFENNNRT